jgi:hypothetical protein
MHKSVYIKMVVFSSKTTNMGTSIGSHQNLPINDVVQWNTVANFQLNVQ